MVGELTLTVSPNPWETRSRTVRVPEGLTLEQMLDGAEPDRRRTRYAVAMISGQVIPRHLWHRVRPRAGMIVEINVTVPAGGSGSGSKILRSLLMLAVVAAAFFLGPLVGTALLGTGTILGVATTTLGQALVGLVGMLVVNAIAPLTPPGAPAGGDKAVPTIEGARNQGRPFQAVPVVLGKVRMAPAFGSSPYTEVIARKHYLRLLFVWGVGPLEIDESSLKIGDTPIADFEGLEIEHRAGYPDDDPLTLYTNSVFQEDLSILLTFELGWVVRRTTPIADEIGFDITFPIGLVIFKPSDGEKIPFTVRFEANYREVGTTDWIVPDYDQVTVPRVKIEDGIISINYKRTGSLREGFSFSTPHRGEYEIRLRRLTQDNILEDQSERIKGLIDESVWSALRTVTDEDPIQSAVPVAKTAMRIKASDQLNGIVDEFTGLVTSKGAEWQPGLLFDEQPDVDLIADFDDSSGFWIEDQPIDNPGSIFRLVLQGNGMASPLPDSRLDLPQIGAFHEWCLEQDFTFGQVRDSAASVWDVMADVAAAGRGAPTQIDGKWSVLIDKPQEFPVGYISPRNSSGFQVEKVFIDVPHAWRVRFQNEEQDYRTDEYRVYAPGFDRSNATKFESLAFPGVVKPSQIYKLGRFRIRQGALTPERWNFSQDAEFITYRRGQRVLITHDVLLVGLASGRVKDVVIDDDNNVLSVILEETVTMQVEEEYGLSVRNINNVGRVGQVVTVEGDSQEVEFVNPIPPISGNPAVARGDIFGFGLLGRETDDGLVLSVMPETDLRAKVSVVPYREAMYDVDSEEIPVFETNLTPLPSIPAPTIRGIVTDESVLARGPGEGLIVRAAFQFNPVTDPRLRNPKIEIQGRPTVTGELHRPMDISQEDADRVFVTGVDSRDVWDFRVRYRIDGLLLPGPWTYINNVYIVGMSTPPLGLQGLTISAFGGSAYLRWDQPAELDVRVGGTIQFRHSAAFTGATWATSVSIGTAALANSLFAVLPLKSGTYLARVFDAIGTPSSEIASVTTKQASIHGFVDIDFLDEAPLFLGIHDNTVVVDDTLRLGTVGLFDDVPDVDDLPDFDSIGGAATEGTYQFAAGFDLMAVERVRLTTEVEAISYSILDLIDNRDEPIDDWEDIDGDNQAAGDCIVFVRHTDDDPSGSPTWGTWERLDSAEFEARGFQFYSKLTTQDSSFNIAVSKLAVRVQELA